LDQSNISVSPNTDATITGTVYYTDGTPVKNSSITIFTTLNGETYENFLMSDDEKTGRFTFTIPAKDLTQDTNTLEFLAGDPQHNLTPIVKATVSKKGELSLTVNKAYEFGDMNNVSESRLISRKGNWDILVNDGREAGPDSKWSLSASTSGLTSSGNKFNGDMIFRNSNGVENVLTGNNVNIASGVKNQTGQQITNIASDWDNSDGIFLRSNGLTPAGQYSGEIDWTLSDVV
jgi:Organic solvent tolerance protein OstA